MSQLVMVRHGQASFFAADYDKLSELGEDQARVLAKFWLERGQDFDEVYCGTLQRQHRTAEVAGEVFRAAGRPWPEIVQRPELNEYDADNIMDNLLPELCARNEEFIKLKSDYDNAGKGRERYRTFHRLLEAVMAVYVEGDYTSNGFEPWPAFSGRVRSALDRIMYAEGGGRRIAVFSSGGPIGISVQTALRAPDIKACELNWRIYNCSLTEFTFSGKRVALDSFNSVAHLFPHPELLTFR